MFRRCLKSPAAPPILIDPRSRQNLRDAMCDLLTSPSRREQMIALGRANARRFSWTDVRPPILALL